MSSPISPFLRLDPNAIAKNRILDLSRRSAAGEPVFFQQRNALFQQAYRDFPPKKPLSREERFAAQRRLYPVSHSQEVFRPLLLEALSIPPVISEFQRGEVFRQKISQKARELIAGGKMHWIDSDYPENLRDYFEHGLDKCETNCWEGVLIIGIEAQALRRNEVLSNFCREAGNVRSLVGIDEIIAWDNNIRIGDVLFIGGTSHVALCIGVNRYASLWFTNNSSLERVTLERLVSIIKSDIKCYKEIIIRSGLNNVEDSVIAAKTTWQEIDRYLRSLGVEFLPRFNIPKILLEYAKNPLFNLVQRCRAINMESD